MTSSPQKSSLAHYNYRSRQGLGKRLDTELPRLALSRLKAWLTPGMATGYNPSALGTAGGMASKAYRSAQGERGPHRLFPRDHLARIRGHPTHHRRHAAGRGIIAFEIGAGRCRARWQTDRHVLADTGCRRGSVWPEFRGVVAPIPHTPIPMVSEPFVPCTLSETCVQVPGCWRA